MASLRWLKPRIRFTADPETETIIHILVHSFANMMVGISLLLWSDLSAESVLTRWGFPNWLWPIMFCSAGILAAFGVFSRKWARFAYMFAALITSVFGIASLVAVLQGRWSAVPTTVFLLYIAYLKVAMSRMIQQREIFIQRATEVTEVAQSALDRLTDGTEPTR